MNHKSKKIFLLFVYLILYSPILVLILYSFNKAVYSNSWQGFTLHWYYNLFHDRELLIIVINTIILSGIVATISTLFGMLGAIALIRYKFLFKRAFHLLTLALIIIPDIVLGLLFLILFSILQFPLGFISLLIAHLTICLPFVLLSLSIQTSNIDKSIFMAAKDLGANEIKIIKKIFFPLLKGALFTSWLLAFSLSFDDIVISSFVAGPKFQILPLYIYSTARAGATPQLNALSTIILAVSLTIFTLSYRVFRKKKL